MHRIDLSTHHPRKTDEEESDDRSSIIPKGLSFYQYFDIVADTLEAGEYRLYTHRIGRHVYRKQGNIGTQTQACKDIKVVEARSHRNGECHSHYGKVEDAPSVFFQIGKMQMQGISHENKRNTEKDDRIEMQGQVDGYGCLEIGIDQVGAQQK